MVLCGFAHFPMQAQNSVHRRPCATHDLHAAELHGGAMPSRVVRDDLHIDIAGRPRIPRAKVGLDSSYHVRWAGVRVRLHQCHVQPPPHNRQHLVAPLCAIQHHRIPHWHETICLQMLCERR